MRHRFPHKSPGGVRAAGKTPSPSTATAVPSNKGNAADRSILQIKDNAELLAQRPQKAYTRTVI